MTALSTCVRERLLVLLHCKGQSCIPVGTPQAQTLLLYCLFQQLRRVMQ
jgi:hypothetical protein